MLQNQSIIIIFLRWLSLKDKRSIDMFYSFKKAKSKSVHNNIILSRTDNTISKISASAIGLLIN